MSKGTNGNIVEEIKERADIVEVINQYVPLKRAGNNYKGICPFHSEKSPSFVVSQEKQIFTCFGCGATGDLIEFLMKYEGSDFYTILSKLAEDYNLDISANKGFISDEKQKTYYEINRSAALFYYNNFRTPGNKGLPYMTQRNISQNTLKLFGIGYAGSGKDDLVNYLVKKNFEIKHIVELGLAYEKDNHYYDRFNNRVIFPIINTRKKVIGFGGRVLGDGMPKYLNSKESLVFEKKNNLYGLNLSKTSIRDENMAILVEGYMDVIGLYEKGVKNVVAVLGTALTEWQSKLIKKHTDNVVLAFDSDEAGKKAAERSFDILNKVGLRVKIIDLGKHKDPDVFIAEKGPEAFKHAVKESIPFIQYLINEKKKPYDLNNLDETYQFLKEIVFILHKISSPIELDLYIKGVARETKISEDAIKNELGANYGQNTLNNEKPPIPKKDGVREPKEYEDVFLENNLIRLMTIDPKFVEKTMGLDEVFITETSQRIVKEIRLLHATHHEVSTDAIEKELELDDQRIFNKIISETQILGNEDIVFNQCLKKIEDKKLIKKRHEITEMIGSLDPENPEENQYLDKLMLELGEINKKMSE